MQCEERSPVGTIGDGFAMRGENGGTPCGELILSIEQGLRDLRATFHVAVALKPLPGKPGNR